MSKNEKVTDKTLELIDKLTEEFKEEFKGLNHKQQALLVYRKIIDLKNDKLLIQDLLNKIEEDENQILKKADILLSIIQASDFNSGFIKSTMLYAVCDSDKEEQELYKDSLISYRKILENYKVLAHELKIENALDLSHLFTYMLWNGYYSVTKRHSYKLQGRLLLPNLNSFDVIKGGGVCLGYAELLNDYLTTCNKKAALLTCKVPIRKNDITCNYRPEIIRDEKSSTSSKTLTQLGHFIINGLTDRIGNHAVTLIEENDKLFIYDPTNIYVLNVMDGNFASLINGNGKFMILPLMSLIFHPNSDPNQLFEKLFNGVNPAFTRKEIIFSFENMMELIKNNINLLNDAYDNIHSELEFIDKQTDEIGGYFEIAKIKRKNKKH